MVVLFIYNNRSLWGESDRYQEYKTEKQRFTLGQPGNALVWLFVLNTVFLVLLLIQTGVAADTHSKTLFYSRVLNWFQLPGDLNALAQRPWTPVTYMFSDIGLFRIISNMLWLWAFGNAFSPLRETETLSRFISTADFSGPLSSYSSATCRAAMPVWRTQAGLWSHPAVMAVAAATILSPGYRFFSHIGGGIPLWAVMIVFAVIDLGSWRVFRQPIPCRTSVGFGRRIIHAVAAQKTDAGAWMIRMYETISNLLTRQVVRKNNMREKVFYNTGNRKSHKNLQHYPATGR